MTGRHRVTLTGRHHADKQQDDRVPPELWPKEDDRLAVEDTQFLDPVVVEQDDTQVLPPVTVEQERDAPSARVAELEETLCRPPRWLVTRTALVAVALLVVVVLIGVLAGCTKPTTGTPSPATSVVCHEEDNCWDCSRNGNKVCGPGEVKA